MSWEECSANRSYPKAPSTRLQTEFGTEEELDIIDVFGFGGGGEWICRYVSWPVYCTFCTSLG
jgi:hypothetical protein